MTRARCDLDVRSLRGLLLRLVLNTRPTCNAFVSRRALSRSRRAGARLPAMPYRLLFRSLLLLVCGLLGLSPRPAAAKCAAASRPVARRSSPIASATKSVPSRAARASQASAGDARARRGGGCARNLQDLVFEMTTAIDAHDANRLAGVYHWTGLSGDAGYQIWTRLEAIANRPLVDIVPVMPASAPPPPPARRQPPPLPRQAATPVRLANARPPLRRRRSLSADHDRRDPVALRVEQTLANGVTPSRTVFGLTRHFGCWWLRLS